MELTAGEIARLAGGEVVGDADTRITGVNGIREAGPGDLTFVRDARYLPSLRETRASAVLIAKRQPDCALAQIIVPAPDLAFAQVLQHLQEIQTHHPAPGVHPAAAVDPGASIGEGVAIDAFVRVAEGASIGARTVLYAGVYIGRNAVIGPDCVLYPNVAVREDCAVGARCILHVNCSIGSDGFGFAPMGGQWMKIPQIGRVVLEDDVEVGSNTAIDRATFGETRVSAGVKIDNLVQIGHNVRIGPHTAIAGMAGISGSAEIGAHVRVGANSGIAGHLQIGDGATIGGRAGVTKSIAPGRVVSGFPAIDHEDQRRVLVSLPRLPELLRRVRRLERALESLKDSTHDETEDHRE